MQPFMLACIDQSVLIRLKIQSSPSSLYLIVFKWFDIDGSLSRIHTCIWYSELGGVRASTTTVLSCSSFFFFHQSTFISYIQNFYGTWDFFFLFLVTHEELEGAGALPTSVAVVEGDASRSS